MVATGWKSRVLSLDYDDVPLDKVIEDVQRLQDKHQLSSADIYRSSQGDNYHVYFWMEQYLSRDKEIEIIKGSEHVDEQFKEFQKKRDSTRMRVKGKHKEEIQYVKTVSSNWDGDGVNQKARHYKRMFERMKKTKD